MHRTAPNQESTLLACCLALDPTVPPECRPLSASLRSFVLMPTYS